MAVESGAGSGNQRDAGAGAKIAGGGPVAEPAPDAGERGAGEQLEGPGEGQIEGRDRVDIDQHDVEDK